VDASIPLSVVDWSNYKNIPKEEERCVQLNAQAINVMLSTLSVEVDEAIFNGQTTPKSDHLIWTRLVDLYGKSKCDETFECESMEDMSIESTCSGGASRN
jgi:cytochrome c-type biogenesis protein CcmH/NrfF